MKLDLGLTERTYSGLKTIMENGVMPSRTKLQRAISAAIAPVSELTVGGMSMAVVSLQSSILDYTQSGWDRDVPKLDLVLDAVGGPSFRRSYKLLRAGPTVFATPIPGATSNRPLAFADDAASATGSQGRLRS